MLPLYVPVLNSHTRYGREKVYQVSLPVSCLGSNIAPNMCTCLSRALALLTMLPLTLPIFPAVARHQACPRPGRLSREAHERLLGETWFSGVIRALGPRVSFRAPVMSRRGRKNIPRKSTTTGRTNIFWLEEPLAAMK